MLSLGYKMKIEDNFEKKRILIHLLQNVGLQEELKIIDELEEDIKTIDNLEINEEIRKEINNSFKEMKEDTENHANLISQLTEEIEEMEEKYKSIPQEKMKLLSILIDRLDGEILAYNFYKLIRSIEEDKKRTKKLKEIEEEEKNHIEMVKDQLQKAINHKYSQT